MEKKLKNVKVNDIMNLIVKSPSVLNLDAKIETILDKIVEDPKSRHVYIIDRNKKLIGSIRLNNVINFLFPVTLFYINSSDFNNPQITNNLHVLNDKYEKIASEIMNSKPRFVFKDTTLIDMIEIMIKENINELPVLNETKEVIGEINMLEIIAYIRKNNLA